MPVYAYRCQDCGYDFEAKQSFNDAPLTDCPNCGKTQVVVRVIQPAGVVFKGSGFYVNDSRGNRENLTGSGNGKSNGTTSATDSETKTSDTKAPETKSTETKSAESKATTKVASGE